jgi:ABC-type phosphate transport system substrate-binding protein
LPRVCLATVFVCLSLWPAAGRAEAADYVVIVAADQDLEQIDRDRLSRLFLKKVTRWADGEVVRPVDLAERSTVRDGFSQEVHGRRTAAIKSYWQRMIFSGRATPPPEVDTEEDVISYVASHPGAIGYVSSGAPVEETSGVRVVAVVEEDEGHAREARAPDLVTTPGG